MSYEIEMGYSERSSTLCIPVRVRERHLTEDTGEVRVQPIGPSLQLSIWTERDDVIIRLPLKRWRTGIEETRSLTGGNGGLVALGKFEDDLDYDEDGNIVATVETIAHDEP